jgi:hypothetical protein
MGFLCALRVLCGKKVLLIVSATYQKHCDALRYRKGAPQPLGLADTTRSKEEEAFVVKTG